jgi:hypothetical protein
VVVLLEVETAKLEEHKKGEAKQAMEGEKDVPSAVPGPAMEVLDLEPEMEMQNLEPDLEVPSVEQKVEARKLTVLKRGYKMVVLVVVAWPGST